MATLTTQSKIKPNWRIYDLDSKVLINPQFPIDLDTGVTVPFGGTIAQQPRFGFENPIVQWVRGKTKTFSFTTMLFAAHQDDKKQMNDLLDKFEAISTKDETLGRSHIIEFTYGSRVIGKSGSSSEQARGITCLVQDADQQIVSMHDDGTPREVRISLTLIRYEPFSQKQIDPSKPAKESFLLVATAAERSYEAIARTYYGQPLLGDRLRKRHPGSPLAPAVGDIVKVPDRSVLLQEIIQPEAHMLSLTDTDAVANFEKILEARNGRSLVFVA